ECGGRFHTDFGSITYPETDDLYPNEVRCNWVVIVSSKATIELKFTSLNTENSHDVVEIRDGDSNSSPGLGSYSGDSLPPSMRTTTNKAFVHFSSDSSTQLKGFTLTWNSIGKH
ncbi:unnamed protein product, partial [Meganyctiphanes norvegica]